MADLVIGLARKVKKPSASKEGADDDEAEEGQMSLDEVEDDAADEMVAAIDAEVDRDAFKGALKDFVVACIKRQGKGDY